MTHEAVIISAVRTPFGRYNGILKDIRPDDLGALVIRAAIKRAGVDDSEIEDVILGCANQAGEDNRDVARMSLLLAGLPITVAGQTVNRLCGSGLQAIITAAQAIACGAGDMFVAGGVESMTRAPFVMGKAESAFPRGTISLQDTTLGWRFINPLLAEMHHPYSMGETAENVATTYGVSRADSTNRRAAAMRIDCSALALYTPTAIIAIIRLSAKVTSCGSACRDRRDRHADLSARVVQPQLARREQQDEVEQAEQQHGVGDIVFEQPDHGIGLSARYAREV